VRRFLPALGLLAVVLVVTATGTSATAKGEFQLKGEVYGNSTFKIEMKNAAGRRLKTVKAGLYRIKIEDKASVHNFRLKGPGVNKATSIPRRTETTWTVRLRPGKYTYLCDPHASNMRGSFRVTR
jgi:plastocyanin